MRKFVLPAVAVLLLAAVAIAASKGTGTLKFVDTTTVLQLTFANKQTLKITSKGMSMPEGTYSPESYSLLKQTKDGKVWRLDSGKKNLGELATITVTKGETTEIDLGAPLKIEPMRFRSSQNKAGDTIIPICYTIKGKKGESYSLEVMMGAQHAPLPAFQILDPNDKVLTEAKFEYG